MSDLSRPTKEAKLSHTPSPNLRCKPTILMALLYRDKPRQPTIKLPQNTNTNLYSLFILFLTEAHFETIVSNTNRYIQSKGLIC
jgi:hypothetical protein